MLVVSLRDVNCRILVSLRAVDKEIYQKCSGVCFSMVSYKEGGTGVSLASPFWSPLRLVFTSDTVGLGVVSEVVRTRMT